MPPSSNEPDPLDVLGGLLSEAEARRQQEVKARRIDGERNRRLSDQQDLRQRLADAFGLAYCFPTEENRQGRKPCPDGFRCWAERFLAAGAILRDGDAAIEGLHLAGRLRAVATSDAPAAMKFACALLLLASEGKAEPVASSLASANGDGELRRFFLWLPFILDNLWHPFPGEDGLIRVALSPDGTSREEGEKAERAFGWRPCGLHTDPPAPPLLDTPEKILSRCEAIQEQQAKSAREAARGVRTDAPEDFAAFLRGERGDAYPLPTLEPLWMAAYALKLGNVPPWRGEPQSGPEAIEALNALADWCRRQISGPTGDRSPAPPPPEDVPRVVLRGRDEGPHLPPGKKPNGVEGGCWLWWEGNRHDIPKGVVYRLIDHMWDRDTALYDNLEGPVFEDAIQPDSLRARVSETNKVLKKIGVPWRLKTDSTSRTLTKHAAN
jgi:hypothetical protein